MITSAVLWIVEGRVGLAVDGLTVDRVAAAAVVVELAVGLGLAAAVVAVGAEVVGLAGTSR